MPPLMWAHDLDEAHEARSVDEFAPGTPVQVTAPSGERAWVGLYCLTREDGSRCVKIGKTRGLSYRHLDVASRCALQAVVVPERAS